MLNFEWLIFLLMSLLRRRLNSKFKI